MIRTDGTGLRPLTDGTRDDREPAFSASGKRVYLRRTAGGGSDIFSPLLSAAAPRNGSPRTVPMTSTREPPRAASSPSSAGCHRGSTVASHHIYVSRVDGSGLRDLWPGLPRASLPTTRNSARRQADRLRHRRSRVDLGSHRRGAPTPPRIRPREPSEITYADPTYAPDGRSLLFTVHGGRSSLHRLDLRRLQRCRTHSPNHTSVPCPAWLTEVR